jgi:alkyl sulfatase BDS1-like metallo-beta-lactamase superfamily hydrolase
MRWFLRHCAARIKTLRAVVHEYEAAQWLRYWVAINWIFPDINEKHALCLENSVLNHSPDYTDVKADVTVPVDRTTLTKVLTKQVSFDDAVKTGQVKFAGNPAKFGEFMSYLVDLNQYFWFNIVTP